jgi:hypothetical protein
LSSLAVVASAVFHVIPVAGTGAEAECLGRIDLEALVGAAQAPGPKGIAELQEPVVDAAAGPREGIKGVEVDEGDDGDGDAS